MSRVAKETEVPHADLLINIIYGCIDRFSHVFFFIAVVVDIFLYRLLLAVNLGNKNFCSSFNNSRSIVCE